MTLQYALNRGVDGSNDAGETPGTGVRIRFQSYRSNPGIRGNPMRTDGHPFLFFEGGFKVGVETTEVST